MFGLMALLLSILTLLIAWAIANNVNRMQVQLDRWEEEVNARIAELSKQASSGTSALPTWTAEVKHKGGKIEHLQLHATDESDAVAQLLRRGIDPSRIRMLHRAG